MNETLTSPSIEAGGYAPVPGLTQQAGVVFGRLTLLETVTTDTVVAVTDQYQTNTNGAATWAPNNTPQTGERGGGTPPPLDATTEAAGEPHETERLIDALGDLLILRLITERFHPADPETFLRRIIPDGIALPTLPETATTDRPLPDLLDYIVLEADAIQNAACSRALRGRLSALGVSISDDIAQIVGEMVADDGKHVRTYKEDKRARQAMAELRQEEFVTGDSDIVTNALPPDENARIIAIFRSEAGDILITRHTYSWVTKESYKNLQRAYKQRAQEELRGELERMGVFGSGIIMTLSKSITIKAIPSQVVREITDEQIPDKGGQRNRMIYLMPVTAILVPAGGMPLPEMPTYVLPEDLE